MEIKTDKKEKISQERLEALAGLDRHAQSCLSYIQGLVERSAESVRRIHDYQKITTESVVMIESMHDENQEYQADKIRNLEKSAIEDAMGREYEEALY